MTTLGAAVAVVIGLGAALVWRRRTAATPPVPAGEEAAPVPAPPPPQAPADPDGKAPPPERQPWGVRLDAPPNDAPMCPQARAKLGTCYRNDERPPLPLPGCTLPHDCGCRYVKLPDRRKGERRSGRERRNALRFDKVGTSDRRTGKDRRRRNVNWS